MWSIIDAAGWPIWTIILASIVASVIVFERFYSLRTAVVTPPNLLAQTLQEFRRNGVSKEMVSELRQHSPLGRVLAAGLRQSGGRREVMKEAIEDEGRIVAHGLEKYLTTLGTIAAMAPLLGLLGTVIGMIEIFGAQSPSGSDPRALAHGISVALYNTAFGLIVAIPAMFFYRHFRARVDALLVEMEAQAIHLLDAVCGGRRED